MSLHSGRLAGWYECALIWAVVFSSFAVAGDFHSTQTTPDQEAQFNSRVDGSWKEFLEWEDLGTNLLIYEVHGDPTDIASMLGVFYGTIRIQSQTLATDHFCQFNAVFDRGELIMLHRIGCHGSTHYLSASRFMEFDQAKHETEPPDSMTETGDPVEQPDDIDP